MKRLLWLVAALYLTIFTIPCQATTICFDGKTLAADSQTTITLGHMQRKLLGTHKIHYSAIRQAWIACAGDVEDIAIYVNHFVTGKHLPQNWQGAFEALIVHKNGTCELLVGNEEHLLPVSAPISIGSGEDAALAALLAGKTAQEAIAIAELVDMYTGGPIYAALVQPSH